MKTYTKIVLVFTMFVLALAPTWAQSSGGSGGGSAIILPIQSQDTVREFALKNVVRGFRSVWSESIDWNDPERVTQAEVSDNGAENVLNGLFSVGLRYKLVNPSDKITGYVYLYDKFNSLLFYGRAEYTAADLEVGKQKPQYGIWIQTVPMLDNVSAAEVLVVGEDGVTANRIQLDVNEHGQLLFQPWLAGAPNGILSVRFADGSLATFNLANPKEQTPEQTAEGASDWKIEGHWVFAGGPVKIIETWLRPTVLLNLSIEQKVKFDVLGIVQENGTTVFERPHSMVVMFDDGTRTMVQLDVNQPTVVEFSQGAYRIRFNWNQFGQPNTLYTGPQERY